MRHSLSYYPKLQLKDQRLAQAPETQSKKSVLRNTPKLILTQAHAIQSQKSIFRHASGLIRKAQLEQKNGSQKDKDWAVQEPGQAC